ncbi:MAG TPA: hypothetical protein VE262_18245 [Blastocatellia bacterium]|nr:hypothetical protein [Blastocatellia bacterium]
MSAHAPVLYNPKVTSAPSPGYQMHVPKPVGPAELAIVIANLVRRRPD